MWCRLLKDLLPGVGYCVAGFPKCTAQADCDASGYSCTDTPHGKYCLEPKIPLTHGGGGAGGTGGMGGGGTGGAGGMGGMP